MSWQEIQTTLVGIAVSAIVGIVGKWFGVKVSAEQRAQAQWAVEQGVAYAAQKLRDARHSGDVKKGEAISAAQSLAPKAMGKLTMGQTELLVDATYARMKASLPHASTYSLGEVPVEVLPPPSKVPRGTS